MSIILETKNLSKKYKSGFEFKECNFQLLAGETIAMLGKNGAGKSTLFQMITGNMDASKGQIFFKSQRLLPESSELKKQYGYLPQNTQLPKWVNCVDILRYAANLYELNDAPQRIAEAIKYWDCEFYQYKPLASCSHGMQKRVSLALATLHDPDCLVLDEPFSGLDIYHTHALENIIKQRKNQGKLTILSTHITPYVAQLCQRAIIIDNGLLREIDHWMQKTYQEKIDSVEAHFFKDAM